jgi:hypothetical protein
MRPVAVRHASTVWGSEASPPAGIEPDPLQDRGRGADPKAAGFRHNTAVESVDDDVKDKIIGKQ